MILSARARLRGRPTLLRDLLKHWSYSEIWKKIKDTKWGKVKARWSKLKLLATKHNGRSASSAKENYSTCWDGATCSTLSLCTLLRLRSTIPSFSTYLHLVLSRTKVTTALLRTKTLPNKIRKANGTRSWQSLYNSCPEERAPSLTWCRCSLQAHYWRLMGNSRTITTVKASKDLNRPCRLCTLSRWTSNYWTPRLMKSKR